MDLTLNLLLILHIVALAVGATTAIALPILMYRLRAAPADVRSTVLQAAAILGVNSRIALATLVVTGGAMLWLRYGGVAGMNAWFWLKMAFVVALVGISIAGVTLPRGTLNPRITSWITRVSLVGAVVAAVFAFR